MDKAVEHIRQFNRFYTSMIGVLDKHILESDFSLSEARVLFEINDMERCTARGIMSKTSIDEGYLSRMIDRFIKLGMVEKVKLENDKRTSVLHLTVRGKSQFQKLNGASSKAVRKMISEVSAKDLQMMLLMMDGIQNILTKSGNDKPE
jgi:DNA-binding MarR family transcriptional regulator